MIGVTLIALFLLLVSVFPYRAVRVEGKHGFRTLYSLRVTPERDRDV